MQGAQDLATVKKVLPIILATSIFMQMLDSTILNTSLASIAASLHESPLSMQNAIISYVLTLAIFMPVSGFLADKYGTRNIFVVSLVLFSLGSLLCSMSQSLLHLEISRVIQGLGGALMTPVGRLAILKTYEKNEVLKALNVAIIPALIGPVMGPLVGGYIVDYLSWHWIFLINIPIGVIGIIFSLRYMPNYKNDAAHFDLKGFLIFTSASLIISLTLEMLGSIRNTTIILVTFACGFLLFYLYFFHAKRVKDPLFPLSLFQIRTFRVGIAGNLITRLGISAIPLLIPLIIQTEFKQSAVVSGWIVAPMALTAMFGKSAVLKILDRLGYRNTLRINTTIIGILIMVLAIPSIHTNFYWYVPILAALGFFNSIQFTSMNSIAIADLRIHHTSSGNSLLSVNQQLAIGFGIAFGLLVFKIYSNMVGDRWVDSHTAYRMTFLTLGMITVLSGFVFRRLHVTDGNNLRTAN